MSLKLRLTLAVVALLAIATGVLGWVVVATTERSMTARVDDRLMSITQRPNNGPFPMPQPNRPQAVAPTPPTNASSTPSGEMPNRRGQGGGGFGEALTVVYEWNPTTAEWDSLITNLGNLLPTEPDLPAPGTEEFTQLTQSPGTVGSVNGSVSYRVYAAQDATGTYRMAVTPLTEVQQTARTLLITILITGAVVVVIGAAACWLVIRRGLRPVDRMIDTAEAIAGGDLSQRVEHRDERTELGKLAKALDDMLTQLEADAAERARAQERLQQFVGDASHELRTPVAVIRGYSELYSSGGLPNEAAVDRAMERIDSESQRMGRLIDDLLLITRLDHAESVRMDDVDVSGVARDSAAAFAVIAPDHRIAVDAPAECHLFGDGERLRRVVDNLVNNAVTHSPEGGSVTVSVIEDDGWIELRVHDDGPGIAPEDRERIFERFRRLDASRQRATGGAGLGLSIVAAIVDAHGGTVDVESVLGEGATFVVRLPMRTREIM